MSTDLTPIKGRIEEVDVDRHQSFYKDAELLITSFSGGKANGQMLQLTTPFKTDHIQLTKQQVKDLISVLTEWID